VAEGGGLLNRYTAQSRIEGSNPSVSATSSRPLRSPPPAHPLKKPVLGRIALQVGASRPHYSRSRLHADLGGGRLYISV
jgi:hypothetical protein